MNEVYKVVQINRKGLGCVATQDIKRKTLILKEKAQIETPSRNPRSKEHAKEHVKANIEIAVGRMSKKDKEEFEKLHDNYEEALPEEFKEMLEKFKTLWGKKVPLEIGGVELDFNWRIFMSNAYTCDYSLRIKMSRFNHSCRPNAVILGDEMIALSNIKVGEEITVSYDCSQPCSHSCQDDPDYKQNSTGDGISMTGKEDRQENFKNKCFSACLCDFCENGKETPEEIAAFKKFAKFEEEAKQLRNLELENLKKGMSLFGTKDQSKYEGYETEKRHRELECYTEMYKLGSMYGASSRHLYDILQDGFEVAEGGYLYELHNKNKSCSCCSQFKEKAENFAKTAEKFHKLLGKEFVKPEIWKRRQDLKEYNKKLFSVTNMSSAFDYESFLSCTRQRAKQPYT